MISSNDAHSGLLGGFRVLEIGPRLAGAVATRLFAELGADVIKIELPGEVPAPGGAALENGNQGMAGGVLASQNIGKRVVRAGPGDSHGLDTYKKLAPGADLIVSSWHPADQKKLSLGPASLQAVNPEAVIVCITPFGLTGPSSGYAGPDLVVFHSSGLAKSLIGPVENPGDTPPVRAHGEQSEFIAGIAAACAGMFGLFRKEASNVGAVIDVSMQEALAFMDIVGLSALPFDLPGRPRKRREVPGPNLTILPAADGHIAISPREEHQWRNFLKLLGDPEWGSDPRFADGSLRQENSSEVIALLSAWSSKRTKMDLFHLLQENRIPCFPLLNPADHLESEQLEARGYFTTADLGSGSKVMLPGKPYQISDTPVGEHSGQRDVTGETGGDVAWHPRNLAGPPRTGPEKEGSPDGPSKRLPLEGVRVVDLSWVIAGPTCTRFLASMGAEVVKVESSGRPDPGRANALHDVLGQGKLGITLDLKSEDGLAAIKKLIAKSDLLIENFSPGVMDRLGLGWAEISEVNPKIAMVSASGTGQSGPTRQYAAYGTLLQIYTGFSGLNGYPDRPPSIGMAWADPMCGMLLAFVGVAALRSSRNTGRGCHVDFSMVEALLSTMPGPLLEFQLTGQLSGPTGNADREYSPHGVFRAQGDDSWVAIAISSQAEWEALAGLIGAPGEAVKWSLNERRQRSAEIESLVGAWTVRRAAEEAMRILQGAGVPASASRTSAELVNDAHLIDRGFFKMLKDKNGVGRLMPTLPWQWHGDHEPSYGKPPALGGDARFVLQSILGYSDSEIASMKESGALD